MEGTRKKGKLTGNCEKEARGYEHRKSKTLRSKRERERERE